MTTFARSLLRCRHASAFLIFLACVPVRLQAKPEPNRKHDEDIWRVPLSQNLMPHFEEVNGRKVLYVDGTPFSVLAVEIPWWGLIYGRYKQTETAYDSLYPAAEKLGLNALKVPIKWSMLEPEKGMYDFSYIDHAKMMAEKHHLKLVLNWFGHYASGDGTIYGNLTGELYAPMYIVNDEMTYPRAVDGDGMIHHNAASYDYESIIEREIAAFRAFMQHLKQVDSQTHTIVTIQVENEIAIFGVDRRNPKMWRDHSPAANKRFTEHGFKDDLKFSAWDLSYNWIRPLTDAGAEIYPIPFFHNYVGGQIVSWMVGGAPGEDVETYLHNCPKISFIGVNSYFCAEWRPDYSCGRESEATVSELREPLIRYRVGRNLPAITEINSGATSITARLAYIAVGEFGVPIFSPWALTVSYPESNQPYVLSDGSLANGASALRETYSSLTKALPQISYYATSPKMKVFMSRSPGQRFSITEKVNEFPVTVAGQDNGQAMVIHPSGHDFLLIGYRVNVSFRDPVFEWPAMKQVRVQSVHWTDDHWNNDGEPEYQVDQTNKTLNIDLNTPEAVLVSW
jgi:hypothetical protein